MSNQKIKPQTWSIFDRTKIHNNFSPISIKEGQKILDLSNLHDISENNQNLSQNPQNLSQNSQNLAQNGQNLIEIKENDESLKVILTCITAPGVVFGSEAERIAHYKTEWHVCNLKLKSLGLPLLTKDEFLAKKEAGEELEDITETDTIPEDEVHKPHTVSSNRINFITSDSQKISLWKNVLIPNPNERVLELSLYVQAYTQLPSKQNWAVFMSSGGRFAGATFKGKELCSHKTFVRYTVRKKQGGSQSSKDNQSGTSAPRSAGATMRRYNEKRFREQILEVVSNWSEELSKCHFIFLCAPSVNWNYFFAGPTAFKRGDIRIRSVPFTVRRPSLEEVKRIHHILTTIEVTPYEESDTEEPENDTIITNNEQPIEIPDEQSDDQSVEQTNEQPEPDKIAMAIINGNLNELTSLFESDYEIPIQTDVDKMRTPVFLAVEHNHPDILTYLLDLDTADIDSPIPGWLTRTALHRAVIDENIEIIKMLLNAGANPAPKDLYGQTPYQIASKNIRTVLRKYAGLNPEMHDWNSLGIAPLTDDDEVLKKKKNAEKNKRKKQNYKIKQQEREQEELKAKEQKRLEQERLEKEKKIHQIEGSRNTKISNLTEREKRALAAEARLSAQKGTANSCSFCKKPLTTIPFERLNFKYCTVECVSKHMDEL